VSFSTNLEPKTTLKHDDGTNWGTNNQPLIPIWVLGRIKIVIQFLGWE
jgi:hypothetical protein